MIKDNETTSDAWVFNCPWHGWELEVFCFRAYDENNKNRWFMVNFQIIEPSEDQRNSFMKLLTEKYMTKEA